MPGKVNGVSLAAIAAGGLFLYSGVKGTGALVTIQGLIKGQKPSGQPVANPLTAPDTGSAPGSTPAPVGLPGKGQTFSRAQVVQLWQQAGGSAGSSTNAACHAMQESSGESGVTSANPDGGINVGLWQLDTKGVGAGHTVAELQDPLTNARITVSATNDGADWPQWSTPGC